MHTHEGVVYCTQARVRAEITVDDKVLVQYSSRDTQYSITHSTIATSHLADIISLSSSASPAHRHHHHQYQ